MNAVVWCGWFRTTEVETPIENVGCGAGRIACLECGGSGVWAFMEPEIPTHSCVNCKGSGKILVSIE